MPSTLRFKRSNLNAIKKRMENMGRSDRPYYIKRDGNVEMYKFKDAPTKDKEMDNMNFIRILPPVADDDYAIDIYVHSYVGPDEGSYICLAKTFGEECPLCALYKDLRSEGEDVIAKTLEPRKRTIYQVLDISEKPQSDKVLVLDAPPTFADEILRLSVDRATKKLIDIADPDTGREISFVRGIKMVKDDRTGKTKTYPEYRGFQLGVEFQLPDSLASEVKPFDDLLDVPELAVYERLVGYYVGQDTQQHESTGQRGTPETRQPESTGRRGTSEARPETSDIHAGTTRKKFTF